MTLGHSELYIAYEMYKDVVWSNDRETRTK